MDFIWTCTAYDGSGVKYDIHVLLRERNLGMIVGIVTLPEKCK